MTKTPILVYIYIIKSLARQSLPAKLLNHATTYEPGWYRRVTNQPLSVRARRGRPTRRYGPHAFTLDDYRCHRHHHRRHPLSHKNRSRSSRTNFDSVRNICIKLNPPAKVDERKRTNPRGHRAPLFPGSKPTPLNDFRLIRTVYSQ